jgi:2-polyprenyl-3-methyl-5-hydroxy-6-metoxy-1,4-benzoquinol methylase
MFEVPKNMSKRIGSWSKLLAPVFIEFVGVRGEVLDVGCGTGSLTFTSAANKGCLALITGDFIHSSSQMARPHWCTTADSEKSSGVDSAANAGAVGD